MGGVPVWYPKLRAAKLLGKAPWELDDVPSEWLHRAMAVERAEQVARKNLSKRKGA